MDNLIPYVTFAAFFTGGFFAGMVLLETDRILNKYLGTPLGIFKAFRTFVFLTLLAVFVVMGTRSLFGRGLVVGLMLRSVQGFENKREKYLGIACLGAIIVLLLFG